MKINTIKRKLTAPITALTLLLLSGTAMFSHVTYADFVEDDRRLPGTYSMAIRDLVRMSEEQLEFSYRFAKGADENYREDLPPGETMGLAIQSNESVGGWINYLYLKNKLISKAMYKSLWAGKVIGENSESLVNRASPFTGLFFPNRRIEAYPADVYVGESNFDKTQESIIIDYWFPDAGLGWFLPGLFLMFRDEMRVHAVNDENVKTYIGLTFLRFTPSREGRRAPRLAFRFLWYFLDVFPQGQPFKYNWQEAGSRSAL